MKLCLCLLYTVLQVTVGCIISEPEDEIITRSPGESVLLSCSCTDLQIKPDEIQWSVVTSDETEYRELTGDLNPEEMKRFSGRVQTFSDSSPGNASLLLSNLTEEDHGEYMCEIESGTRTITLIVSYSEHSNTTELFRMHLFIRLALSALFVMVGATAVICSSCRAKKNGQKARGY
ncbi:V-set and immunoglobulin domain-containing protein 1-like [Alosa sapidissima]|uniref:V-set and immunoglobulin domain-containing protein 1-like n=1 Tax=Alosa sapidissima TaxID=34773 RepID=UPI001C08B37F|nr:V-set and immunoglobulin domain-containing protein 1-like [Alosa sapidissima]